MLACDDIVWARSAGGWLGCNGMVCDRSGDGCTCGDVIVCERPGGAAPKILENAASL